MGLDQVFRNVVLESLQIDPVTAEIEARVAAVKSVNPKRNFDNYVREIILRNGTTRCDSDTLAVLYAYTYLYMHLDAYKAIIRANSVFFEQNVYQKQGNVLFIDIGCGPMTSALALADYYQDTAIDNRLNISYIGIDIEPCMMNLAARFSQTNGLFGQDFSATFVHPPEYLAAIEVCKQIRPHGVIIFNFSYIFGQNNAQNYVDEWVKMIKDVATTCKVENVYTVYLNKDNSGIAGAYNIFKRGINQNDEVGDPISCRYRCMRRYNGEFNFTSYPFTTNSLYYEICHVDWANL